MGRVISQEEATAVRRRLVQEGRRVVFTNGHFDLLHTGHVRYLQQARELGDVLIVGLNSDESTRRLKGEKRPIVPQGERAELLAALACVDYVVVFQETTAERLVGLLRPDVYVKGGDWSPEAGRQPPEARVVAGYGGEVRFLPYVDGRSTTDVVQTILARYGGQE